MECMQASEQIVITGIVGINLIGSSVFEWSFTESQSSISIKLHSYGASGSVKARTNWAAACLAFSKCTNELKNGDVGLEDDVIQSRSRKGIWPRVQGCSRIINALSMH